MKRLFILLFALLPMLVSAQPLTPFCHKNGKWGYEGYVKGKTKAVIKPKFESARKFQGSYAFVRYKGLWGIIGKDGKFVVKPKYNYVGEQKEDYSIVKLGDRYGIIKGTQVSVPFMYDELKYLDHEYAYARINAKWGLVELDNGRQAISVRYDKINVYEERYLKARIGDKYELFSRSGYKITTTPYDDISLFEGKFFKVKQGNKYGLLNLSGKQIAAVQYDSINIYERNFLKVKQGDKCGLLGLSGKMLLAAEYDDISAFEGTEILKITAGNKSGLANSRGEIIAPLNKYTDIKKITEKQYLLLSDSPSLIDLEGNRSSDNVLLYTTSDGNVLFSKLEYAFGVRIVTNVYIDGLGVMILDRPITMLGEGALLDCDRPRLTSITIPNGVTEIGRQAFICCESLTSITMPSSVNKVEYEAFCGCENIKSVYISDLNAWCQIEFGYEEFEGPCRNPLACGAKLYLSNRELSDLIIPEGITEIKSNAFSGCSSLRSVVIPNGVKAIPWNAFYDCKNLTKVIIPNSVSEIHERAFAGCEKLSVIKISKDIESIEYDAFYGCSSLPVIGNIRYAGPCLVEVADKNQSSYTIRPGTRVIGAQAFKDCKQLKSITIPSTVTCIGPCAFENCTSLKSFYCKPLTPPANGGEGEGWFADIWQSSDCPDLLPNLSTIIYVPRASVQLYRKDRMWSIRSGNIVGYDF